MWYQYWQIQSVSAALSQGVPVDAIINKVGWSSKKKKKKKKKNAKFYNKTVEHDEYESKITELVSNPAGTLRWNDVVSILI